MADTTESILDAHLKGTKSPEETITHCYERVRAFDDPALFISIRDESDAIAEAKSLKQCDPCALPLYGLPFVVKDNIDVAGLPTSAACPAYTYTPRQDATVVRRLREAGAIVVGKTNLDQFATGLVGVRSPYGVPRNPLRDELIPGGSSAGSATAVAAGIVPVALGTDTAGSGRVPAMLNNIVGLKPSLGLVSTAGVVPACRTLDCVSVFALTVDDAWRVLKVMAGPDPHDPFSRTIALGEPDAWLPNVRLGVPALGARIFFGDQVAAAAYEAALKELERLGATVEEIDFEPFHEAARLLYEGPWLAERYLAIQDLLASSPDAVHPVTRQIIGQGARPTAAAAFAAFYRLEELRRIADATFRRVDALAVPTAPTVYTVEQVLADPIQLNSRLGTYTNFVNLLNLCGVAVPTSLQHDRTPFGVTLLAPAGRDAVTASIGRALHAAAGLPLGATTLHHPAVPSRSAALPDGHVELAVLGAHLSGLELNGELIALGARFRRTVVTTPDYRFYLLPGGPPRRPGLVRVEAGQGAAIEAEVWAMPVESFGRFVAGISPPLGIGTVRLADGVQVKGFLAEAAGLVDAHDITKHGGWHAFLAAEAATHQTISA